MDKAQFEAALRADGFTVVNSSQKPNQVTPNHCHDFDARVFVLGGEITITRDNTPVTFRTGDCCEVPAGCMHAEHVGPEPEGCPLESVGLGWAPLLAVTGAPAPAPPAARPNSSKRSGSGTVTSGGSAASIAARFESTELT